MLQQVKFLLFHLLLESCRGSPYLYEGSNCTHAGLPATCILVPECPKAVQQIHKSKQHEFERCGFKGETEIICCPIKVKSENATENILPTKLNLATATSLTPPVNQSRLGPIKSKEACKSYSSMFSTPVGYHIYYGVDAKLGEFPHMVALGFYNPEQDYFVFDCGGTIISEQYVITAAHCLHNSKKFKLVFVRVGVLNLPHSVESLDSLVDVNVAQTILHPNYKRVEKRHDVALVKLAKFLTWTQYIRPACLYSKNDNPLALEVTGWGLLATGNRSNILQKATLKATTIEYCSKIYSNIKFINTTQICAADEKSDACSGDSGGPLQIFEKDKNIYTIVGITSFGIGCASRYPGVFTRVASYLSWIEDIVW